MRSSLTPGLVFLMLTGACTPAPTNDAGVQSDAQVQADASNADAATGVLCSAYCLADPESFTGTCTVGSEQFECDCHRSIDGGMELYNCCTEDERWQTCTEFESHGTRNCEMTPQEQFTDSSSSLSGTVNGFDLSSAQYATGWGTSSLSWIKISTAYQCGDASDDSPTLTMLFCPFEVEGGGALTVSASGLECGSAEGAEVVALVRGEATDAGENLESATSGTVTITSIAVPEDDVFSGHVAGSVELTFPDGTISGSFVAPYCQRCVFE